MAQSLCSRVSALPLLALSFCITLPAQATSLVTNSEPEIQLSSGSVQWSRSSVDFGQIEQGQLEVQFVRVTNAGTSAILIQTPEVQGADMVFSVNSLCIQTLLPGESCTLEIEFFPQDFWGDFSATVSLHTIDRDTSIETRNSPRVQVYGRAFQAR